jgi:tetratricopeptide (TPR) repeat protein
MRIPYRSLRRTVLLAVLLSVPDRATAAWVRVETPNFIVFGEPSEKRVREVAEQFERFREALGRVLPGAATKAAVPTVVVVFNSSRSFEPYRPRFNGKPIALGGFFVATDDQNLVALTIENREHALRTIFHEYAHLVVANLAREVPAWVSEGLAEYYSTFDVRDEGRTAILGRPIDEHLVLLNQERLIPHAELLKVDSSSPLYNEGERRSVFYAQSWALVHMLALGEPNRSHELGRYVALTSSGISSDAAWAPVFGAVDINAEIRRYVARSTLAGLRYTFKEEIPAVRGAVSTPGEAQIQATLGNLLYHVQQQEEAVARLEKAVAVDPMSAHPKAQLGLLRLDQNRREEAERLLVASSDEKSDWLVQYQVALGVTDLLDRAGDAERAKLAAVARQALTAVLVARPELPHAMALRARISTATGTGLDDALQDIRRARALAPGREDYAFDEAHVQVERRQFDEARKVLGPLLTSRYHTAVRENARMLMTEVARVAAAHSESERWRQSRESVEPAGRPDRDRPRAEDAVFQPIYRKVLDGEQRSQGLLERIDCTRQAVVLHLRTGETLTRFSAPRIEAIDFITYREDLQGPIKCHPRQPPDPVYLTWRPAVAPSPDAIAIAVEFLPKR